MSANRNIILRRLAALLLFAIVLLAFAALFYFKIVPGNREDLNQRGHKALTQQVQNFLRKDQDLHNIIGNAGKHFTDLVNRKPPYDRLYANIHYNAINDLPPDFHHHLLRTDTGVWMVVHHQEADTAAPRHSHTCITIKMKDFADPIFAGRDDVFKDYLILLDAADTAGTGEVIPIGLSLLYQQFPLSASARVNADTTRTLVPNSDQTGSFRLSMAGQNYIAFFSRFEFHLHHLILVGLIDKNDYDRKLSATPPWFLPMVLILIGLALIVLPFLKVFLLSPHESINSGDVLKMALSFYAGGVVVTIIAFYFFLNYVTSMALETRLRHLSGLVRGDVEQEIAAADYQLKAYDSKLGGLSPSDIMKHRLATDLDTVPTDILQRGVDGMCIPDTNLLVSRILWLDTLGRTRAKWSPFRYPTPFTNQQNYVFYHLLITKPPIYDGVAGVDEPVVYPGKSNLTAEFLTYIGRASNTCWPDTALGRIDTASFIVIADVLRASLQPVIPPGFSFSIIDNNGNVLVDGDSRKSLEGNLFEESEQNRDLLHAVRFDKTGWLFPLEIRGVSYFANVTPITGQPLHLVCYYSRDIVLKNLNRMMHFSIHTLVLLWCLLGICLLLSTFHQWKPMILKFNFEKVEWIRPASSISANLPAIYRWMLYLTAIAVAWFAGVAFLSTTLTPLFYLSLLFPFYVVLGVQIFHKWLGQIYSAITIAVLNGLILWMISASTFPWSQELSVAGFQLMAAWGLWDTYRKNGWVRQLQLSWTLRRNSSVKWLRKHGLCWLPKRQVVWLRDQYHSLLKGRSEYFRVLRLSILLLSILPTLGILAYAFYAEKVQYKKEKLDALATAFTKRSNYLLTNFIPSHKATMQQKFDTPRLEKLLFNTSIYLTDRDVFTPLKRSPSSAPGKPTKKMPDALYALLMDDFYQAPLVWNDDATIPDGGKVGHGMYSLHGNMVRYAPGRLLGGPTMRSDSMVLQSHLQKPLMDLIDIPWRIQLFVLGLLLALALLARKLVKGAINHLFLIEIVSNGKKRFTNKDTEVAKAIAVFTPREASWMPEVNALGKIDLDTLELERGERLPNGKTKEPDEDFILAMTDHLRPLYAHIFWEILDTDEERYVLYDFSIDRYTNYKNSAVLYRIIAKGVLVFKEEYLDLFSPSFRQFVLSLPEGEYADKLAALQKQFQVPGTWQSVRIPAIAILLIMGVFLFTTQPQVSTLLAGLAVLATSLTTILTFVRSSFTNPSKS